MAKQDSREHPGVLHPLHLASAHKIICFGNHWSGLGDEYPFQRVFCLPLDPLGCGLTPLVTLAGTGEQGLCSRSSPILQTHWELPLPRNSLSQNLAGLLPPPSNHYGHITFSIHCCCGGNDDAGSVPVTSLTYGLALRAPQAPVL